MMLQLFSTLLKTKKMKRSISSYILNSLMCVWQDTNETETVETETVLLFLVIDIKFEILTWTI